jgi:hypothetical protein
MRPLCFLLSVAAVVLVPVPAESQDPTTSLRQTVEALAHDSAAGRATPSSELDKAALYIASKFRAIGAKPLGDDGGYFQRYPVTATVLDTDSARIQIGSHAPFTFLRDFFYAGGGGADPDGVLSGPAVVVSGAVTPETVASAGVSGKVVVFLSPLTARGAPQDFRSAFAMLGGGAKAVIVPGGRSDSVIRNIARDHDELMPSAAPSWEAGPSRTTPIAGQARFRPVLELGSGRWERVAAALALDTASLRNADGSVKVTPIGENASLYFLRRIERVAWPSNVVAVIPGSDPVLRHEYVILTAHYDGLGRAKGSPPGPQSILNGADDNASGIAALLQVAGDVSAGQRPRRSIIFAAVSGEEMGLWGSDILSMRPPVPIESIVADINMDMIGRASADSVFVTGRTDKWLGPIAARVLRQSRHGLTVLDEPALEKRFPGEKADDRSDHANFRKRGVPPIAFFTGWHDDYHETSDDADKVNYDALARITALIRDLTVAVANARR